MSNKGDKKQRESGQIHIERFKKMVKKFKKNGTHFFDLVEHEGDTFLVYEPYSFEE